jgi:hypothetical protein
MRPKLKLHAIQWAGLALIPLFFTVVVIQSCAPRQQQANLAVINNGERVVGKIISKGDSLGYERGSEANVKYSFANAAGQELSGSYLFPESDARELFVDGEIEIAYDAEDPSTNLPVIAKEKESDSRNQVWLGIILVSLILLGAASFLGYVAWETWRLHF